MIPCTKCNRWFKNQSGFTRHYNAIHEYNPGLDVPIAEYRQDRHPFLTGAHVHQSISQ